MTPVLLWRLGAVVALPVAAFALGEYHGGQLAQFMLLGAVAGALALTWGTAGILNLGHSVTFGAGAYVGAWFGLHGGAVGSLGGLLGGAAAGGLVAVALSWLPLQRVNPITFALATFVTALAAEQVANRWTAVTGGFNGLTDVPRLHLGAAALSADGQRAVTTLLAVIVIWVLSDLSRRPLGAALKSLRDDERRSASLGYHTVALKIGVFAFTGTIAGLLGAVFALQVGFVAPGLIGVAMATNFVVWTLLGSKGTIAGPAVATVLYNVGVSELADKALNYWVLLTGAAFVFAVLFVPEGLALRIRRWLPRAMRRPQQVSISPERPGSAGGRFGPGSLSAEDIVCRFGAFTAVAGVSLTLRPGEVHCLIGPNGAGKSTLLNVLSGVTTATGGRWYINEHELTGTPAWQLTRAGAARKFQSPSLATSLSVGQNLALARWAVSRGPLALWRQPWTAEVSPAAWAVLESAGLVGHLDTIAGELSHGQRQFVELAMALAPGCSVLLLDEPTAGMTRVETAAVGRLLTSLTHRYGLSILVVEHDIAFIRGVADRVTVMSNGAVIASGSIADIEDDRNVRAVYLGRAHRSGS